jgi:hypothetical protein
MNPAAWIFCGINIFSITVTDRHSRTSDNILRKLFDKTQSRITIPVNRRYSATGKIRDAESMSQFLKQQRIVIERWGNCLIKEQSYPFVEKIRKSHHATGFDVNFEWNGSLTDLMLVEIAPEN